MKRIAYLAGAMAVVAVSGCATLNEPAITYKDAAHPLEDTAVFAIQSEQITDTGKHMMGAVLKVDDKSMKTFSTTWKHPVWVRVLPGDHHFEIIYSKYPQYALKTIDVAKMQPRHVYVAWIRDFGGTYRIHVQDMGENSAFVEHLPKGTSTKSGDFQATF